MPLRTPWVPDESLVLVVACCRDDWEQVRQFGVYPSRNHRSMRPAKYLAFYSGGKIDTVAEIDGPPEDDVVIAKRSELAELAEAMSQVGDDPRQKQVLLRLKNIRSIGPILNDAMGKSGKRVAWTQSQSYTRIADLKRAKRTTELPRA